jgi:hypothetical protein
MKKQAAIPIANPAILMAEYILFLAMLRKAMVM